MIGEQLKVAARFVKADASAQYHLHAVARLEANEAIAVREHRTAQLRAIVLQREVPMAGTRCAKVR